MFLEYNRSKTATLNDRPKTPSLHAQFQKHRAEAHDVRESLRHQQTLDTADDLAVEAQSKITVRNLNFFYGSQQVLFNNTLNIADGKLTAVIGPSGSGKSTHVRVYNRIFELYDRQCATGEVCLDSVNILAKGVNLLDVRRRVGMVFQAPTTFPLSIFENVAYGLRRHYRVNEMELADRVEAALLKSELWQDVQDKLHQPGRTLSSEQQQRLCLARVMALEPDILVLDDPTAALDPFATRQFEEHLAALKRDFTIVMVTHNLQQASRLSDFTAFFYQGNIMEYGPTSRIFTNPRKKQTEAYLTGRFVV